MIGFQPRYALNAYNIIFVIQSLIGYIYINTSDLHPHLGYIYAYACCHPCHTQELYPRIEGVRCARVCVGRAGWIICCRAKEMLTTAARRGAGAENVCIQDILPFFTVKKGLLIKVTEQYTVNES